MNQNTKYLDRDGVKLAYQIHGQADRDLILVPGIVSHVEYAHRLPGYTDFILRLAKTFRVVIFDKRGNGLSGRIKAPPTLEERMDAGVSTADPGRRCPGLIVFVGIDPN